jgi:hypothetical protein
MILSKLAGILNLRSGVSAACCSPVAHRLMFATLTPMTRILHCDNAECPKDWEKLPLAGETHIRVCTVCLKAVYRVEDEDEARRREEAGHRAAIPE